MPYKSDESSSVNLLEDAQRAYVIFSAQADMPWLKILRPGFRHCAVLIHDGQRWLTLDPLSSYLDVTVHEVPVSFDLPGWMEARGHTVVPAKIKRPHRAAPIGMFTCVEAVKRAIGLHKRSIITPWQLFKFLEKQNAASALPGRAEKSAPEDDEGLVSFLMTAIPVPLNT